MGGRYLTRSRAGETMSCTRAIRPSRSPCEEASRGLHVAILGSNCIAEECRDSVLEASHLNEISSRSEGLRKGLSGHQRSEEKQSSLSTPSIQSLPPYSPSESFTSLKVSKLGFSSSSSYSSSSSFNETGSSPASVTSAELKQAECSPARRSFQRINLAPKLAAVVPLREWDDTEMHCKCSSSPAQSTGLKARPADNSPLENLLFEGTNGRRQLCSKTRNDKFGFNNLDWAGYDKGDKISSAGHGRNATRPHITSKPQTDVGEEGFPSSPCIKSLHCVLEGPSKFSSKEIDGKECKDGSASFRESSDSAVSLRKCSIASKSPTDGANAALHATKYSLFDIGENSHKHRRAYPTAIYNDVQCEIHVDGALERCNAGSKLRKDRTTTCNTRGDSTLEGHESNDLSMRAQADAQLIPKCVPECSSTPYEADIGVDTSSLQLRAASLSPNERTKIQRGFSLHQLAHANETVISFQTPSTPKPKLEGSTPSHLLERGTAFKRPTDQCTSTEPAFGKRKVASNGFSDRGASTIEVPSGFSDRKPSMTQALNRSHAIVHPQDHTRRDAKAILIPPVPTKHHFYNEFLKPSLVSHCDEKADVFTMQSPLLLEELKYSEGGGARTLNPPMVPLTSKLHWDWRSKSMGAKASLKSAVRNLEVTFASSRSISLPKTRARAPKDSKPESTRLLERVFVSPIRARSKQAGFLKPVERPLFPSSQSNVAKEHGAFWRRDAKTLTTNGQSHHTTACAPAGFVVRPFPPNGYKELEVTCKPFLPVSRSVRCLPAPRSALGIESLVSSGRKAYGCSSNALESGMLHAHLLCVLKDGLPFYTMIIEGSDEMLLARACWQENHSSKEGCKWQYSFHSGQGKARGTGGSGGWRNWIKKESKAVSDLCGIMQVSSTLRHEIALAPREGWLSKVLEFILYDGKEAGVAHSQSLRFCPMEKPFQKSGLSRESPSSFLYPSSEHVLSSSPSQLDTDTTNRQHVRSLTEFSLSSKSASTASGLYKGNGAHRPSLSLDVWSDSDVPDSVQVPSSCSPSHVELAALVIQVSAEGHQRDSNVSESDHIGQNSKGWGLKFLDGGNWSELKSHFSHVHTAKAINFDYDELGQGGLGTIAELKPGPISNSSSHLCARINKDRFLNEDLSANEELQAPPTAEKFGMQGFRSFGNVTFLLPTGDHSFPNGGTRGPSSLIDRWRSGGSCECGGWDLGCGIKVITSGSPTKKCVISNKHSISCDQQFSLFAQGSKQELMLGLSLVKQGEFKLSFQGQLSPLKAFSAAVAMLHSHEPTLLPLLSPASPSTSSRLLSMPLSLSSSSASMSSSTSLLMPSSLSTSSLSMSSSSLKFPLSSTSSLLSPSSSLMSSSAIEAGSIIYNLKVRPPRPPQLLLAAPRRSDSSSKDKISPFLVHNQTFSN